MIPVTSTTTEDNMAGIAAFLKNAWNTQPVLLVSSGIALLAVTLPVVSPWTKYSGMMNAAVPYNYPVPMRDDGNMPDVPSHPSEAKGPSLEWMKAL